MLKIIPVFLILLFIGTGFTFNNWQNQLARGNKELTKGSVKEAIETYRGALVDAPEEPLIHYNLGGALYQNKEFKQANEHFTKALNLSKDNALQAQSAYNLGNTAYREGEAELETNPQMTMNKWEEALQQYKKAMQVNPEDEDAKYNYEFVKKKLDELKESQQNQENNDQQQNGENNQDENKENSEDKENNNNGENDNSNQGQSEDSNGEQQPKDSQNADGQNAGENDASDAPSGADEQTPADGGLTEAQALQLLEQFEGQTGEFIPLRPEEGNSSTNYKDW